MKPLLLGKSIWTMTISFLYCLTTGRVVSERRLALEERRKYVRIPATLDVRFRKIDAPPDQVHVAVTKNIGGGGVFIPTDITFPPETLIELSIALPGKSKRIESIGKVIWVKDEISDKGMGVEFFKIKKADRNEIISHAKRGGWYKTGRTSQTGE